MVATTEHNSNNTVLATTFLPRTLSYDSARSMQVRFFSYQTSLKTMQLPSPKRAICISNVNSPFHFSPKCLSGKGHRVGRGVGRDSGQQRNHTIAHNIHQPVHIAILQFRHSHYQARRGFPRRGRIKMSVTINSK